MRKLQAAALVAGLAFTLGLSACGGSDESKTLNDASAGAVGTAIAAQVASAPVSFTAADLGAGGVGGGFQPSARALPTLRWAGASVAPGMTLQAPCPAIDNLADADGDGVPDDATFTFVQADCGFGVASYLKGAIHILDPSPSPTAVGYGASFQDFLVHYQDASADFADVGFNGTHSVLGTPDSAKLSENLTTSIDAERTDLQNEVHTIHGAFNHNWTLDFIPAQGQTIVMNDSLPDGTFDVNGTFTYDVNRERFRMAVITKDLLVYSAACHANGDVHPFTSGELRAHLQGENGQVYVRVVYNNCQEPIVTFVGRTT